MTAQEQKLDVKQFVGKNIHTDNPNTVSFQFYRQGHFYYAVENTTCTEWFIFPVPMDDIGTATLNRTDKAITFMRWIRKAIVDGTFIKQ